MNSLQISQSICHLLARPVVTMISAEDTDILICLTASIPPSQWKEMKETIWFLSVLLFKK